MLFRSGKTLDFTFDISEVDPLPSPHPFVVSLSLSLFLSCLSLSLSLSLLLSLFLSLSLSPTSHSLFLPPQSAFVKNLGVWNQAGMISYLFVWYVCVYVCVDPSDRQEVR